LRATESLRYTADLRRSCREQARLLRSGIKRRAENQQPAISNQDKKGHHVLNYVWFFLAAVFEIGGCYAFYLWLRIGKSAWWIVPALISLSLFGLLLTRVEAAYAGRAYAAYGGIYILTSLLWLAVVEKVRPAGSDWLGALLCVAGACVILWGPKMPG
jgi:small multidrug resistance family-3 protein